MGQRLLFCSHKRHNPCLHPVIRSALRKFLYTQSVSTSGPLSFMGGFTTIYSLVLSIVKIIVPPGSPSLQGGVSDEVTLSAYITATFLELNMSVTVSNIICF